MSSKVEKKFVFKSMLKSRLFMYGLMIFSGYVFTKGGGWDFYDILKFIAMFVAYEVWTLIWTKEDENGKVLGEKLLEKIDKL